MNVRIGLSVCVSAALLLSLGGSTSHAQQSEIGFFITSKGPGKGGDLGGLAGADQLCQLLGATAGAMGLEDQAAVKRVADEHGSGVVVLLGTPDAESTQTLAQTVVAGDPSYAGPLAGVPLGLPVFHVFEPEVRDQVPGDVYEAQVALMEMSLDRDAILAGLSEARRAGATT